MHPKVAPAHLTVVDDLFGDVDNEVARDREANAKIATAAGEDGCGDAEIGPTKGTDNSLGDGVGKVKSETGKGSVFAIRIPLI